MKDILTPILYALLAALFYAINTPFSKLLLASVPSTFMAAFLYLGAGVGVGIMYVFHWRKEEKTERLGRKDYPYTIGMILISMKENVLSLVKEIRKELYILMPGRNCI